MIDDKKAYKLTKEIMAAEQDKMIKKAQKDNVKYMAEIEKTTEKKIQIGVKALVEARLKVLEGQVANLMKR